jgi:diguanylate cyclase (GGDEF)-like protein
VTAQLDLADAAATGRVRSLLVAVYFGGSCLTGLVALLFAPAALGALPMPVFVAVELVTGLSGLVAAVRGARLGDTGFLAVNLATAVAATWALVFIAADGNGLAWEFFLVPTAITTCVFCVGRRYAVMGLAVTTALVCFVAWYRLRDSSVAAFGAGMEGFIALTTGVASRLLRELAHDALTEAHRGEVTDALTGLVNRRGLDRLGPDRWKTAIATGRVVCVLVIDVDHFKRVNDTQGHAAGDAVLKGLGELLDRRCRADDVVVRLGGEEFAVLGVVPEGAGARFAESLRQAIEAELSPVTVSIGVHEASPGSGDPLPEVLWRCIDVADRALYVAKQAGRNRVVSSESL